MKTNILLSVALALAASCGTDNNLLEKEESDMPATSMSGSPSSSGNTATSHYFTAQSTVGEVIGDTAFGDFGRLLFPVDRSVPTTMTLAQASTSSVYIFYTNIKVEKTVEILNYLRDEALAGRQIFYRFYSDSEIASDPTRADTGLFFFRGTEGAPFAVTNAGGAFAYVGAMHDSFPHSLEIARNGSNAFALIYRPDEPYEDLARVIAYIHDHATDLGVGPDGYSLWGGSAGARMAATLGNSNYLHQLTGRTDIPQAAAVIMQYTGYNAVSEQDAPTYACVGTNDGIASWRTMQNRLQRLSALGIPTEFHAYEGLSHGFGISNFDVSDSVFNLILKEARIKPAVLQMECHPYAQRLKVREKAKAEGIQVECWFPLGGAMSQGALLKDPVIMKIAEAHGKTAAQVILRWHIQEGFSVIPGATNPDYIKENGFSFCVRTRAI